VPVLEDAAEKEVEKEVEQEAAQGDGGDGVPIVFVVFGEKAWHWKDIETSLKANSAIEYNQYEWLDVRPYLIKDPAAHADHQKDGSHVETQSLVMSQSGYPKAVAKIFEFLARGVTCVFVYCTQGLHRSQVVARQAEDVANCLRNDDQSPVFFANIFRLQDIKKEPARTDHLNHMMWNVASWLEHPWLDRTLIELPEVYGVRAAKTDRAVYDNWNYTLQICSVWPPACAADDAKPEPELDIGDTPAEWSKILQAKGVDAAATMLMMELAYLSMKGRAEAKRVCFKLATHDDIRNSSAFVSTSSKNALNKLADRAQQEK
jgi:hypothetical protein